MPPHDDDLSLMVKKEKITQCLLVNEDQNVLGYVWIFISTVCL